MSSGKLRVLVLMHEDLVPPDDLDKPSREEIWRFKTEYDVVTGLRESGHEIYKLGVWDELAPLRDTIKQWSPDIVFNLLEEWRGQAVYDHNVVSYLELMRTPYTGCNPRGLVVARDKALSKKILAYHRIRVPRFAVAPMQRKFRRPRRLEYPLIVKSLIEEASTGIARASVVDSDEKLAERIRLVHEQVRTDAIVEQYIDGRELYVGVMGNHRLTVLPVWELNLQNLPADSPRIATRRLKTDLQYQKKYRVTANKARGLSGDAQREIARTCKRIYRNLGLSGYARLDFRRDADGNMYFLEANPNPEIARDEEFAGAAKDSGLSFEKMLDKMLRIGLARVTP